MISDNNQPYRLNDDVAIEKMIENARAHACCDMYDSSTRNSCCTKTTRMTTTTETEVELTHIDSSFGNSSLSSFLSVLFEDRDITDDANEIVIIPDNPKSNRLRAEELPGCLRRHHRRRYHHQYMKNTLFKKERRVDDVVKPPKKDRWDLLIREDSNDDLRQRKMRLLLEHKSSSFSGPISSLHSSSSSTSSYQRNNDTKNKADGTRGGGSNSLFLRMPQRQKSPTTSPAKLNKKNFITTTTNPSLVQDRWSSMSDTDLLSSPMKRIIEKKRVVPDHGNNGFTTNSNNSRNATWSKSDLLDYCTSLSPTTSRMDRNRQKLKNYTLLLL